MGSSLAVAFFVFVTFCTNEEGYPLETRTDDKCFFSLAIIDCLVTEPNISSLNPSIIAEEKKQLSSVLGSNGYLFSLCKEIGEFWSRIGYHLPGNWSVVWRINSRLEIKTRKRKRPPLMEIKSSRQHCWQMIFHEKHKLWCSSKNSTSGIGKEFSVSSLVQGYKISWTGIVWYRVRVQESQGHTRPPNNIESTPARFRAQKLTLQ